MLGTVEAETPVAYASEVTCRFGRTVALDGVGLALAPGEIHAILGSNGAGKTTLLRSFAGLVSPTSGSVEVDGRPPDITDPAFCRSYGYVPSGTRSLYLRISGIENLLFFARLQGWTGRVARERCMHWLDLVGLTDAAHRRVGVYSQGMQRRLVLARALLSEPRLLLLDEVTHDLDPDASERIRALVASQARHGSAVVWATQRVDEIRTFADTVTVLREGAIAFQGTVGDLIRDAHSRRFLVRLRNGRVPTPSTVNLLTTLVGETASVEATREPDHFVLSLQGDAVLGDAVTALSGAGYQLLSCREERSTVETALRQLALAGEHRG